MSFDDVKQRRAEEDREREMREKAEQDEVRRERLQQEQEASRVNGMVRRVLADLGDAVMGKSLGFLPRYTIMGPSHTIFGPTWVLCERGAGWNQSFVNVSLIVSSYGMHFNVNGARQYICDGVSEDELVRALRAVINV